MKRCNWVTKIVTYVLAVCMVMANLFVVDTKKVNAADSTTVYFWNAAGLDEVYGYVYKDDKGIGAAWPGTMATKSNLGENWYEITVPLTSDFHIIMNNGNKSADDTSRRQYDSYIERGGESVYVTTLSETDNKVFYSQQDAKNAAGSGSIAVYFKNSKDWDNVYGYVYKDDKGVGAAWPGTNAERVSSIGDNWYKIDIPLMASNLPFQVIFHNGKEERTEVQISDQSNLYITPTGEKYNSSLAADTATGGDSSVGSGESGSNTDLDDYEVKLSRAGAKLPYNVYEAEAAVTNAEVMESKIGYQQDIQSEASGRQAVKLNNTGDYVEFELTKSANSLVLRYSMPDSADGAGLEADLNLYVNENKKQSLSLTSKYAWVYGGYPYTNTPGDGKPHRYFDEMRVKFDETFPAGTKIRLQKDASNTAANYIIDFIECENVPAAITQPQDSLSITNYGAIANDGIDDAQAIRDCIAEAQVQKKIVWIPEGTFTVSEKKAFSVENVTIQGAGMWYSALEGAGASFWYKGTCKFYDFAMTGVSTVRNDAGDLAGFEGTGTASNITIENIWMEHMKVGVWSYNTTNMVIQGCRIRNTYADGINLSSGNNSVVVRNNNVRNTGDDGIAIWPNNADSCNNTIEYNTVQVPTLANAIAVYGGAGNVVQYNYVADTVANGGGICLGTNFPTSNGFTGTTTVKGNQLVRCGSWHCDYDYPVGALWFWATNAPMKAEYKVENNEIFDCSYEGILFDCWQEIAGVRISDTNVYGAKNAIYARGNAAASVTINHMGVADIQGELIKNEDASCTITADTYATIRPEIGKEDENEDEEENGNTDEDNNNNTNDKTEEDNNNNTNDKTEEDNNNNTNDKTEEDNNNNTNDKTEEDSNNNNSTNDDTEEDNNNNTNDKTEEDNNNNTNDKTEEDSNNNNNVNDKTEEDNSNNTNDKTEEDSNNNNNTNDKTEEDSNNNNNVNDKTEEDSNNNNNVNDKTEEDSNNNNHTNDKTEEDNNNNVNDNTDVDNNTNNTNTNINNNTDGANNNNNDNTNIGVNNNNNNVGNVNTETPEAPITAVVDGTSTIAQVSQLITSKTTESDVNGSTYAKLSLRVSKTTNTSQKIKWNKVSGADGYVIFAAKCGSALEAVKTITSGKTTSWTNTKLNKGTYYKYVVLAYKQAGEKQIAVSTSKLIHVPTSGGKYTDIKSISVNKTKVTLAKGKTFTIKAKEVKKSESKKVRRDRKISYESTDTKIATVSKSGKIKAKEKGKCYVYAYAQNGVFKKIKIIVK